jgi:hypothetical protein
LALRLFVWVFNRSPTVTRRSCRCLCAFSCAASATSHHSPVLRDTVFDPSLFHLLTGFLGSTYFIVANPATCCNWQQEKSSLIRTELADTCRVANRQSVCLPTQIWFALLTDTKCGMAGRERLKNIRQPTFLYEIGFGLQVAKPLTRFAFLRHFLHLIRRKQHSLLLPLWFPTTNAWQQELSSFSSLSLYSPVVKPLTIKLFIYIISH